MRPHHLSSISVDRLALLSILLLALGLRVYNIDWDRGKFLHPDELHILNVGSSQVDFGGPWDWETLKDPDVSPLNPRSMRDDNGLPMNYAYGALPLLLTDAAGELLERMTGDPYSEAYGDFQTIGRAGSAIVDTLTVLLVFLIGGRLFGRRTGLLAAAIYAGTPMAIQLSHFFTTDTWLTFFVTLTIYATLLALDRGTHAWFALAGACFGWSIASKGSVILLAGIVVLAAAFVGWRERDQREDTGQVAVGFVGRCTVAGIAALVAFTMFEPYVWMRMDVYLEQLREQQGIVSGEIDVPYTRRYVGTVPGIYQVEQLVRWGLGPVAGIAGLAGIATLAYRALKDRRADIAILLGWLGLQAITILLPEVKFLRYLLPITPVLAVAGAVAIVAAAAWVRSRVGSAASVALLAVALVGVGFWTASFMRVYAEDNPRITASEWMYANVPPGSAITAEGWDDSLPLNFMPGLTFDDKGYERVPLEMYDDRPPQEAVNYLYGELDRADYVVLSSNRVSASIENMPWRYPVQNRYYDLLDSGEMGFTKVGDFHVYPGVGPFEFPDQAADESFVNYDHPRVLIYQKTAMVDRDRFGDLFASALDAEWVPNRYATVAGGGSDSSLMLDEPVGSLPVVDDARWSASLTDSTPVAVAVWVALLLLLHVVGAPIARYLFRGAADGGSGLARVLAVLLSAWLVWFLASWQVIKFQAVWAWAAVAVVGLGAVLLWRRHRRSRTPLDHQVWLSGEIVFWAVFGLFLLFRFINPDSWHPIWGGEKPMEFAHLNATLRSAHFPPFDPWYSDGYINYYYYGLYLVAFLIKLTGIPSEIAFNLAQPTVMALMASSAFSVAAMLGRQRGRPDRTAIVPGVLGALLVVGIGNVDAFIRILRIWPDPIEPSFDWTWGGSRTVSFAITEFPYFTGLYADLHAHGIAVPITVLMMALAYNLASDVHGWSAVTLRGWIVWRSGRVLARLGLASLCLGTLYATNAWDLATYAALTGVSIFAGLNSVRSLVVRLALTGAITGGVGLLAGALFFPFYLNYVALFSELGRTSTPTSIEEFSLHLGGMLAILGVGLMTVFVAARRTAVGWWLFDPILPLSIGLAVIIVAVWSNLGERAELGYEALAVIVASVLVLGPAILLCREHPNQDVRDMTIGIGGAVIAAATILTVSDRSVLALSLTFLTAGAALWLVGESRPLRFVGSLVAAGAGVFGGLEVVYLADNLNNSEWERMNSIFKFYNQIWILFAIAAAALLGRAINDSGWGSSLDHSRRLGILAGPPIPSPVDQPFPTIEQALSARRIEHGEIRRRWSRSTSVVGAAVIAISLVYPIVATGPRLAQRFEERPGIGTLDGYAWMDQGTLRSELGDTITFAGDRRVIDWFNEEVPGTPVILEASFGPYRGNSSRISINTGLPTVLGWDNHETQQRYLPGIGERSADVRELYSTTDVNVKRDLLAKYRVAYVVIGDVERYTTPGDSGEYWADPAGITALEAMVGTDLELAFDGGATKVYRVVNVPETDDIPL